MGFIYLQKPLSEINRDEASAAAHPAQIAANNVAPQLVTVDDHGGEGRDRVERRDVNDKDPDVPDLDLGLFEEGVDGAEDDHLGLLLGALEGALRGEVLEAEGVGAVAEARPLEDLADEGSALVADDGGDLVRHHLARAHEGGVGLIAGEINEVDLAVAAHEVDGGEDGHEGGAADDGEDVVAEVVGAELPHLLQLGDGEVGGGGEEEGEGEKVHGVRDEVVVAELYVLEAD